MGFTSHFLSFDVLLFFSSQAHRLDTHSVVGLFDWRLLVVNIFFALHFVLVVIVLILFCCLSTFCCYVLLLCLPV